MGVNLKDIIIKKEISIPELAGKKLVIDGNNILYQFLSSIRQADGTLLMDSKGNVTSHLNGLFHRTSKLMQQGIKPVFVFDGVSPELKRAEQERRAGVKEDAKKMYEAAKQEGDVDLMKKYSMRTSRLTKDMIAEAVELITAMGIPVVQAPSEGEAQAAVLVKEGDCYAEISQDYDCLLFGVPRMIQNLTISERKKKKDKLTFETVKPVMIELAPNLELLGVTNDQLIVLGMLIGTDYNIGGIKGIGPKKALGIVKEYGSDFEKLFETVKWNDFFTYDWKVVFNLFKEMPVKRDYSLVWHDVDYAKVVEILCDKHEFSHERVNDVLDRMKKSIGGHAQKGLGDFF